MLITNLTSQNKPPTSEGASTAIDNVLIAPEKARLDAVAVLADSTAPAARRVDALWTLGKGSLEANRIAEARGYLEQAVDEADDLRTQALIRGTLAVALSKCGELDAAFRELGLAETQLDGAELGRLVNQRAMLFFDHGDLVGSDREFRAALELLRAGGDELAETRTVINLGVVASIAGRIDEAERWFEESRELALRTGQRLVAAGAEGNLAFAASRRADYPSALARYQRARDAFAELGDVGLSVANLEYDYAETLLEIGLDHEAIEAATRSLDSSLAGDNTPLAAQARLLLAQALVRRGRPAEAREQIRLAVSTFSSIGLPAWIARAESIEYRSFAAGDVELTPADVTAIANISARLADRGFARESAEAAIFAGQEAIRLGMHELADRLLRHVIDTPAQVFGRLRPDIAHARALRHVMAGRRRDALAAIATGLRTFDTNRTALASTELRTLVGGRALALGLLATRLAIEGGRTSDVLRWADRCRALMFNEVPARPNLDAAATDAFVALRTAYANLEQARLAGEPLDALAATCRRKENAVRLLIREQTSSGAPKTQTLLDVGALRRNLAGRLLVEFIQHGPHHFAVVVERRQTRLVPLVQVTELATVVAAQGAAARRMGSSTHSRRSVDAARQAFDHYSDALDAMLLQPLRLPDGAEVVIVPTGELHGVLWSACAELRERPFTLTPSATAWNAPRPMRDRGPIGLIAAPGIEAADEEISAIAAFHTDPRILRASAATVQATCQFLETCDIVHFAGHGSFRRDNPLFSNLQLVDGPLNVFDIEMLRAVPSLVIIAACDAAASSIAGGDDLIGTAAALLRIGVRGVVAPLVSVADTATRDLMVDFHSELASGLSPQRALASARTAARARSTPADVATASAFQYYGTSEHTIDS